MGARGTGFARSRSSYAAEVARKGGGEQDGARRREGTSLPLGGLARRLIAKIVAESSENSQHTIDGVFSVEVTESDQVLRIFSRFSVTLAVALRVSITKGACCTIAS